MVVVLATTRSCAAGSSGTTRAPSSSTADGPNLLIPKHNIRYMFKEEELRRGRRPRAPPREPPSPRPTATAPGAAPPPRGPRSSSHPGRPGRDRPGGPAAVLVADWPTGERLDPAAGGRAGGARRRCARPCWRRRPGSACARWPPSRARGARGTGRRGCRCSTRSAPARGDPRAPGPPTPPARWPPSTPAATWSLAGAADALVTAPVSKASIAATLEPGFAATPTTWPRLRARALRPRLPDGLPRARPPGGAAQHPPAAARRARRAHRRGDRRGLDLARHASPAAASRPRGQPARRRGRAARPRGRGDRAPRRRRRPRRGIDAHGPEPRLGLRPRAPRRVRLGARPLPRPGPDRGQDRGLRQRHQLDSGAALPAHLGRPRHRLRARRPGGRRRRGRSRR
jgi:hypothetical protein